MIIEKKGNLLAEDVNLICHQVNCMGVMNGGIALQIKNNILSNEQFLGYEQLCMKFGIELLGQVTYDQIKDDQCICNCFAQNDHAEGQRQTDYDSLSICLNKVHNVALSNNLTVGIPAFMGCGLAGGDWNYVYNEIIVPIFKDSSVELRIVNFN